MTNKNYELIKKIIRDNPPKHGLGIKLSKIKYLLKENGTPLSEATIRKHLRMGWKYKDEIDFYGYYSGTGYEYYLKNGGKLK
jgi:uncharacterized protein YneF (UPF0154 family)